MPNYRKHKNQTYNLYNIGDHSIPYNKNNNDLYNTNRLAMLLTFALREIGEGNVTEKHKQHIAGLLKNEDRAAIERDFPLMPAWVQVLIMKLYE